MSNTNTVLDEDITIVDPDAELQAALADALSRREDFAEKAEDAERRES